MGENKILSGTAGTAIKRAQLVILCLPLFLSLLSCSGDGPAGPRHDPTLETFTLSGKLEITGGSTLSFGDLAAVTFAGGSEIDSSGNFTLEIPVTDRMQIICFPHLESGAPVYFGLYDPVTETLSADSISTAKALMLLNAYLICSSYDQRVVYLHELTLLAEFGDLVASIAGAQREDARHALDYLYYPGIFQAAVDLMKSTMLALSPVRGPWIEPDPPSISGNPGGGLLFVNPRQVYYAAGIYPNAENLDDVLTIDRPRENCSYSFGWPPEITVEPAETTFDLDDGYYRFFLSGGFAPADFDDWDDPVGRATSLNLGQSFILLMDLALGALPEPDRSGLSDHLDISSSRGTALETTMQRRRPAEFVRETAGLMRDEGSSVADWIWDDSRGDAEARYVKIVSSLLHDIMTAFVLLDMDEAGGPFFGDLVRETENVEYFVSVDDGAVTLAEENYPPQPDFTVTPESGAAGAVFTFDATATSDDSDSIGVLEFRWDWNGDGTFDTVRSVSPSASHQFDLSGVFTVKLEVRDGAGLTGEVSHLLQVCDGAGTRLQQVKVYLNTLPYSSLAIETVLVSLGYTHGLGDSTFQVISGEEMGLETLLPWRDLVIITNDQDQQFYDAYAEHQLRFSNFIYQGGTMFWGACAHSMTASIEEAGIVLPGAVTLIHEPDEFNFLTDPPLPLVSDLPDTMDHNFASNRSFENIPEETAVYCIDSESRPTLIEIPIGEGRVILSGQPLEHQFETIYGNPDMEELLPAILTYLTGS